MRRRVTPSLVILGVLVIGIGALAIYRGGTPLVLDGLRVSWGLFAAVAPQLLLGFALAGLVTVLLPADVLARLVGEGSGFRGLLIASVAGIATPGGPFVQFPLMAAIASAGAGPGPMAAYLTAWSLMGWNRIVVYELPLLGPGFTVARVVVSLAAPLLVGALVPVVLRLFSSPR